MISSPRQEKCAQEVPELREVDGVQVACHFAEELHLSGFDYEEPHTREPGSI